MDNTDKVEDWQMLRVGRKLAVRSGMRKEEDNTRMTTERKVWVGEREKRQKDKRRRAGQIWAKVTLGRWLTALSSVYITLTVQAKAAMRQKWNLQHDVCLQVNSCQSIQHICADLCVWMWVFFSTCKNFQLLYLSAESHTMSVSHSMCLSSQAQTNCLLFSRGQGLVGLQSTQ